MRAYSLGRRNFCPLCSPDAAENTADAPESSAIIRVPPETGISSSEKYLYGELSARRTLSTEKQRHGEDPARWFLRLPNSWRYRREMASHIQPNHEARKRKKDLAQEFILCLSVLSDHHPIQVADCRCPCYCCSSLCPCCPWYSRGSWSSWSPFSLMISESPLQSALTLFVSVIPYQFMILQLNHFQYHIDTHTHTQPLCKKYKKIKHWSV